MILRRVLLQDNSQAHGRRQVAFPEPGPLCVATPLGPAARRVRRLPLRPVAGVVAVAPDTAPGPVQRSPLHAPAMAIANANSQAQHLTLAICISTLHCLLSLIVIVLRLLRLPLLWMPADRLHRAISVTDSLRNGVEDLASGGGGEGTEFDQSRRSLWFTR
ncbi:hypothetical protein KC19_3G151000 [Ceratodon purpureus]|uniref:Uncharacterized protein n=1 Tax=Ceratodon purpureus TaxID=3225 RepID=A0A8T0IM45_CERPU|nr:hypothetical protein KC19_3G151000 [Ceratodon purpureus]